MTLLEAETRAHARLSRLKAAPSGFRLGPADSVPGNDWRAYTTDRYRHLIDGQREQAAKRLDAYLNTSQTPWDKSRSSPRSIQRRVRETLIRERASRSMLVRPCFSARAILAVDSATQATPDSTFTRVNVRCAFA